MDYPKRLIEVDLPIKRISAHARREKSIRHGHISTLHIWWARRPLAACRAVICAALWPDPADEKCPPAFRDEARRLMTDWAKNHLDLTSPESMSRFTRVKNDPKVLADNVELRKALLDFIADFANWDNSTSAPYLTLGQSLTAASHMSLGGDPDSRPLVADPFAGGGSIPLEALRVGADAFASDLNPVPVLLNRVVLEYVPKHGDALAEQVEKWGGELRSRATTELASLYPLDPDGSTPIAYLWARTIKCDGPGCGAEVPMLRSLWLSRKGSNAVGLQVVVDSRKKHIGFRIVRKEKSRWIDCVTKKPEESAPDFKGTTKRSAVTCPCCAYTTPAARVRAQFVPRKGGASDARLVAVVTVRQDEQGRSYRLPATHDFGGIKRASSLLDHKRAELLQDGSPALPDEPLHVMSGVFNAPLYGHDRWATLFTPRQQCALLVLAAHVREIWLEMEASMPRDLAMAVATCLAIAVDRQADRLSSLCRWDVGYVKISNTFSRQALPFVTDFAEANPLSGATGDFEGAMSWVIEVLREQLFLKNSGTVEQVSASSHCLPDDSVAAFVTDPPYYNAVPYADLSDFFVVWLRRMLRPVYPTLFRDSLAPKADEICQMSGWDPVRYPEKDAKWFEDHMASAMAEGRRVLIPSGISVVVFAHKTTAGWEAQLQAMVNAGWVVTGSWPIDTEMGNRLRAMGSAALASSVHLVCRPRETASGALREDTIGDWRAVLAELPKRIHEWMPRLAEEGVVGADAIFACLGPALEIFSRYSRVEKASGEVVTLREYLEQVWAAVSTEALSMIFRDADAAGLESDARFTAMVLWTLGAGGASASESTDGDSDDTEDDDDDDSPKPKPAKGGYTLEYDAARKIAQGLGVNLEQIDSVVEVKGDKARLRPVSERAAMLFGKAEKAEAATKKRGKKATQKKLFDKDAEDGGGKADTVTIGEGAAATPGVTALDRVHQAMLLFAGGRADALKRFIVEDGVGGDARFWKLAQSLSALYPAGSDEKRQVDGVLARKKSFGF